MIQQVEFGHSYLCALNLICCKQPSLDSFKGRSPLLSCCSVSSVSYSLYSRELTLGFMKAVFKGPVVLLSFTWV